MGNRFKREIDISSLETIKEQCVVNENDCWVWQHAKTIFGYGNVGVNKKVVLVHRYVYEMSKGKIPKGMLVRHSCDNPACCNPKHLLIGTQKDNAQDAIRRGRISCGIKHGKSIRIAIEQGKKKTHPKLNQEQAEEIKTLRKNGMLVKDIANRFNVSETIVSLVSRDKRWKMPKHWTEVTPMDLDQSIIEAAYKYVSIIDRIGRGELNLNYERTEAHDEFITLLQHAHITGIGFDWDGRGNARELAERIVTWIRE